MKHWSYSDGVRKLILFLDFDGVLHPAERAETLFCCKQHLWTILRSCPQVDVVFSTSWRETHSFKNLVELVTTYGGEDLACRFVGATSMLEKPDIRSGQKYRSRELECEAWLAGNSLTNRPWLAVDDVPGWFSYGSKNVYITDYRQGLTEQGIAQIIGKCVSKADVN